MPRKPNANYSALAAALRCNLPGLRRAAQREIQRALKGRTQAQAAERLGTIQPRLAELLREHPDLREKTTSKA